MNTFMAILQAYIVHLNQLLPREYFTKLCSYKGPDDKGKLKLKTYWAYFRLARTERVKFWRSLWTLPRLALTMHYGLKTNMYFSRKKYLFQEDDVFGELKSSSVFGFLGIDQKTRFSHISSYNLFVISQARL